MLKDQLNDKCNSEKESMKADLETECTNEQDKALRTKLRELDQQCKANLESEKEALTDLLRS